MENVRVIREWLKNSGYGYGYGDVDGAGYGYGYGVVDGACYGYGSGAGYGYGVVAGAGYDDGDGDGAGYGYGYGSGAGYGYGSGAGYGDGDGAGISSFRNKEVFEIDEVPTIIYRIKDSVAKGAILNSDFTLTPCFVVKGNGYFAHGNTLREARKFLLEKIFDNMDSDEAIERFMEKFKKGKKYPGTDFFEWHHYLTGSCLMGRENFVKNKGLDLNELYAVEEFISICENDYGSKIIKELKERWNDCEEDCNA